MSDNELFDITSEGGADRITQLLRFLIQPDGNVHQPKFWSVVPAEEGSERNRGWQAGHLPSGPRPERLVLWWTDSGLPADVQATLHPILGSSVDIVGAMVHAWLTGEATYDRDDAFQAGVVGLARAVQMFDPGKGFKFSTYAVGWIRAAIQRDRGRFDGVDTRRAVEHGDPLPERPMAWDDAVTLADGHSASLDDILPAPHSDPAPVAIMRADLGAAIRAALAACNDDLDRALVAAIVHHDPFGPVAAAAGRSPQTGHSRAARLLAVMRSTAA